MNLVDLGRSAVWVAITSLVVATATGATTALTGCGEAASCTKLRTNTYASKQVWDACDPLDPNACVLEPGNPKDCTGVLTCDFAINPRYRVAADLAVYRIGEESQGCYLCAVPNCVSGSSTMCEPVTRRCVVVPSLLNDGGTSSVTSPGSGAGSTVVAMPEASTVADAADGSSGLLR